MAQKDERTPNFGLQLPDIGNLQTSDCIRIRNSLVVTDEVLGDLKVQIAGVKNQVGEDLQKELAAIKKELEEAGKNQGNMLGTALGVDEDGYLCVYKEEDATDNVIYSISDDGYLEISYAAG